MASEVPRDKIIGNFKVSTGLRPRRENSRWREERDGMSERHLAAVRKSPCCSCLKTPAGTVHHLKCAGGRGLAVRAEDKKTVPLCILCHDAIERVGAKNEFRTFQVWGIADVVALAAALWGAAGSVAKMTKIVIEHKRPGA